MFDQLMGNMDQYQEALRAKLDSILLEESVEDGAVVVAIKGTGEIVNISIDDKKCDLSDKEQIEDLVLIAVNKATLAAKELEKAETEKQLKDMLPPGFGNLLGG